MRVSRHSTFLFIFLASLVGLGLFQLKYRVVALEENLKAVRAQMMREEESYHVLKAEWKFLTDPQRIQELATKHLGLQPSEPHQLIALHQLPFGQTKTQDRVNQLLDQIDTDPFDQPAIQVSATQPPSKKVFVDNPPRAVQVGGR